MTATPLEILKGARKLIEHGRAKGMYNSETIGDPICKFCPVGAMLFAAGHVTPNGKDVAGPYDAPAEFHAAVARLAVEVVGKANYDIDGQPGRGDIYEWNDYGATDQDVLDAFDRAIAKLEAV